MNEGDASATAQAVAAHRLSFERVRTPYGDPDADDRLADDVAATAKVRVQPGPMREYLRARTRFFDRVVVASVDAGINQVIVGAAGYDARSLRYQRPGVSWFELDHPSTQADKRARLERLGIDTSHVRFVAADFALDPVAAGLHEAGLDPRRPSLVLLEGVAVYLDRSVLERLLHELADATGPRSRLAISLSVATDDVGRQARRARFQVAVAALGEPTRSEVRPDEVADLLEGTGWHVDEGRADRVDPERAQRLRRAGLVLAERALAA